MGVSHEMVVDAESDLETHPSVLMSAWSFSESISGLVERVVKVVAVAVEANDRAVAAD